MSLYYYSVDPRIKRIKQQEKEAREAKKRGIAPGGAPAKKTKKEEEEEKKKREEEAKQKEEEDKVCVSFFFSLAGDWFLTDLRIACPCGGEEAESCCCECGKEG